MTNPALDFLSRAWRVAVMADRDGAGVSPQAIRMHNATERELRVAGAWAYDSVINRGIADWLRDMSSDLGIVKAYLASIDADLTDAVTGLSVAQLLAADRYLTTIYDSPADVAIAAGGTSFLTPWLDVERYSRIGAFLHNNAGVNPLTGWLAFWAPNADGSGYPGAVGAARVNAVISIANNASYYAPISAWNSSSTSNLIEPRPRYRGLQIAAGSTLGTVGGGARVTVLGAVGR